MLGDTIKPKDRRVVAVDEWIVRAGPTRSRRPAERDLGVGHIVLRTYECRHPGIGEIARLKKRKRLSKMTHSAVGLYDLAVNLPVRSPGPSAGEVRIAGCAAGIFNRS